MTLSAKETIYRAYHEYRDAIFNRIIAAIEQEGR